MATKRRRPMFGSICEKAAAFGRNLCGAAVINFDDDAVRYMKKGYYLIKDRGGKVLSFGVNE